MKKLIHSDPPLQGGTLQGVYSNVVIGILTVIGLFFFTHPVFAYDLTITCGASACSKDTSSPLFPPSEIWYPTHSAEKIIHFVNTTGDTRTLSTQAINSSQTGDIDTVMQFLMRQSGSSSAIWDNTLHTLYESSAISLPDLSPNGTFDLAITITMHSTAGNEFQNKKTAFDLAFTISGVTESVVVQTVSDGETTTTSTTTTTNPAPTTAPITQIINYLPQFFAPAGPVVAGAQTETPPTEIVTPEKGDVEGATTCETCIWWPLLVLQALSLLFHYQISRKNKKAFWKGGILLSLLTYAFFLFLNRSCRSGWELWLSSSNVWCTYFIIWVLLVFSSLSYLIRPTHEEEYIVQQESPKETK